MTIVVAKVTKISLREIYKESGFLLLPVPPRPASLLSYPVISISRLDKTCQRSKYWEIMEPLLHHRVQAHTKIENDRISQKSNSHDVSRDDTVMSAYNHKYRFTVFFHWKFTC